MTIALGLWCDDGIVLCTDSQITVDGGLKFNAKKIHTLHGDSWVAVLAFAGSADLMKLVDEMLYPKLLYSAKDHIGIKWADHVRENLTRVMKTVCTANRGRHIEVLCATSDSERGQGLWRARDTLVTDCETAECLGVGDSSVLRFLSDLFVRPGMRLLEALVLGCYMISKANTYIDRCGGPIQCTFITSWGKYQEVDTDAFSDSLTLKAVDDCLGELFHLFYHPDRREERMQKCVEEFRKKVTANLNWPKIKYPLLETGEYRA